MLKFAPTSSESVAIHGGSFRWFRSLRILLLQKGNNRSVYSVKGFPADFGRGFQFAKLANPKDPGPTTYEVLIGDGFEPNRCDCKGHASAGHCKHVDAAIAIANLEMAGTDVVTDDMNERLLIERQGKPIPSPAF